MVKLHVKKGNEGQFLFDTTVQISTDELIKDVTAVYNARLKINRVCSEMEELAKHGTFLPVNMQGLNDDQIEELRLVDEFSAICIPGGGDENFNKDPMGRRNGKQPNEKMRELIHRTIGEVKAAISHKMVKSNLCLTYAIVKEQLDLLRGACTIVYPMNLPPHDPIRLEFENKEELGGTHDAGQVIPESHAELWFCGKQIIRGKKLMDFIGKNEKTKVIVKIQKGEQGPPAREPVMSEADQKELMLHAYRKQQKMKYTMGRKKINKAPLDKKVIVEKKRNRRLKTRLCYKCRVRGHMASDCPKKEKPVKQIGAAKCYEVAEIKDDRLDPNYGKQQYLVQWVHSSLGTSWEFMESLTGAMHTVVKYERAKNANAFISLVRGGYPMPMEVANQMLGNAVF